MTEIPADGIDVTKTPVIKKPEIVFNAVDTNTERQKLRTSVEKRGFTLPETHELSQLIKKVSERLGVPSGTEFIIQDSEEVDAFFHPNSKIIGFSRGFCRFLLERNLPLTEDHIAAVLSHEIEHAEVLGDEYVSKVESSFTERLKGFQHHAEEYRADAQGMERLARGGYNPKAMIEMLKALPLTTGRYDLGHPEQIDRIRKLEDRLADDEHPLPNTSKERTTLDADLLKWLAGDSPFYNHTEELIHETPEQLQANLLATTSQTEFWTTYEAQHHIERVGLAKDIVAQNSTAVSRLTQKLMILEAFGVSTIFQGGKAIEKSNDIHNVWHHEKWRKDEGGNNYLLSGVISNSLQPDGTKRAIASSEFRAGISRYNPQQTTVDQTIGKITDYEGKLDIVLTSIFQQLESTQLPAEQQQFVAQLKKCWENGQITDDLFMTVFSQFDKTYQTGQHQEASDERAKKGLRAPDQRTENLFDLSDQKTKDQILDRVKLDLTLSMLEGLPDPQPEVITHLTSVIVKDTGLSPEASTIVAETMLLGKDGHPWADYLKAQERKALTPVIRSAQALTERGNLPLSPLRSLHHSYRSSLAEISWKKRYAPGGEFNIDAGGLKVLKMLPGMDLYKRGWPVDHLPGWKRPNAMSVNLSLEEWNAVVDGEGDYGAWSERDIWVLRQYIQRIQSGLPVEEALKTQTENLVYASSASGLTAQELKVLIEHNPWHNDKLQRYLNAGITNLPHQAATSEERKDILTTLHMAYDLYNDHPLKRTKEDEFWHISTPTNISSHMLDVLVQENASTGIPRPDALTKSIKELSEQGVGLLYGTFSKEVIAVAGELSDQNLTEITSYLKGKEKLDSNQTNLYETMLLLSQIPPENRAVVAPQIFCETTVKSLLQKYPDKAVKWVTTNLGESNLRDRLLVGLIDYADGETKAKYLQEAKGHFTNSPDKFGGKQSAGYPFDTYYWFVKEHEFENEEHRAGFTRYWFHGEGRLKDKFPDLLARRHPFSTFSPDTRMQLDKNDRKGNVGNSSHASPYQRFYAKQLVEAETVLFDQTISLSDRIQKIKEITPRQSVVRDIELEMIMQEEFIQARNHQERIEIAQKLLPLFTEKSALKIPLAVHALKSEIALNPSLLTDFEKFTQLLTTYLPEPSLARNYFLGQFENSAPLTADQLRQIIKMRMSPEGKKEESDDSPMTFVANRFGELNREERIKTTLWLLGLSTEKPLMVLDMEEKFDGHLNNLPKAVAMSTDDEKEVLFKRLFLGAEGIVDLEAVPEQDRPKALEQRKVFAERLATHLLPDSMAKPELFRNMFITIIESSDPAHASQLLTRLINRLTEAQVKGQTLLPEEVIAIGLSELGVVGKKVAQSIAEQDWVPDSYKRTLRRSQSEGAVVPKRALLTFVEDSGLLNDNSPIKIISFDELIGAASNKQACLMTIEITGDQSGFPKGRQQIVGKFKRPSAQKMENLDHDLRVLENVLSVLRKAGYGDTLPKDFSTQISNAVRRELDFNRERIFADEIRPDLEARNKKRKTQVMIPQIIFTSDDLMLETRAEGISLRNYYNLVEQSQLTAVKEGYTNVSERSVNQAILSEGLAELITTGRIHADLHPGNIFVDKSGNITLIDLGMHEKLTQEQRFNTMSLLVGLITGNEALIKQTLHRFGWDVGDAITGLKRYDFSKNTLQLLKAGQKTTTPPPEVISSIIVATSKLTSYTNDINYKDLFTFLLRSADKREIPRIITHVIRSGNRDLLN